jgi:hypothetical protein
VTRSTIAALLCCAITAAGADPLQYAGLGLDTPVASLAARFPRSVHEFTMENGRVRAGAEAIGRNSGRYVVRLAASEVVEHVQSVTAAVQGGVTTEMRLSFERSAPARETGNSLADFESRHPPCAPMLADLSKRYGKPAGPEVRQEERLVERRYAWRARSDQMVLVCGQYEGRPRVFAMDVILSRARP